MQSDVPPMSGPSSARGILGNEHSLRVNRESAPYDRRRLSRSMALAIHRASLIDRAVNRDWVRICADRFASRDRAICGNCQRHSSRLTGNGISRRAIPNSFEWAPRSQRCSGRTATASAKCSKSYGKNDEWKQPPYLHTSTIDDQRDTGQVLKERTCPALKGFSAEIAYGGR